MKKIGIIHTTSATIDSLNKLAKEMIDDVEIVNFLDDSILKDMIENKNVEFVRERWISYAKTLENLGVVAVLSACSTVGKFAEEANEMLDIPVYRIDDAMATEAVESGKSILVLATLKTTLTPTVELIKDKSKNLNKENVVETHLVEDAYDLLLSGNAQMHNEKIKNVVENEINNFDVIVLAQASMAKALEDINEEDKKKILTSPVLGIKQLKGNLEKLV